MQRACHPANRAIEDARRKGKDFYLTTIDFTNAFGSVLRELILPTLKQRCFPEWVVEVVRDMYDEAKSTIFHKGQQTELIRWKKGVKQGSPFRFNLCLQSRDPNIVNSQ
jgi:hypothetical protein